MSRPGLLPALAAPLLFGAGAALSKVQLEGVHPLMMAGLLYVSAGLGLGVWRLARPSAEARLMKGDLPRLSAVAFFGGLLGPALLMLGLSRLPAASASLLLNLEAPFTALLAAALFKETVGRRTGAGIALVTAGSAVLSGFEGRGPGWAYAAVAAACLCWAVDNNLTQKLSERDPVRVAAFKGAAAGLVNLGAAALLGAAWPAPARLGWIALIGLFSYGASLVCYLSALRRLGAARTAMYFALAPFAGAGLAVLALGEPATPSLLAAAALMGAGVWLSARERHEHAHRHEQEHEHLHVHDEHHRHAHARPVEGAHSHRHSHAGLAHSHPHEPDIHHRH